MNFFPFPQFCTIHRNFIYFSFFFMQNSPHMQLMRFRAYGPGILAHSAPKYLTKQ